ALVSAIDAGGPAAGQLTAGDVITAVNGASVAPGSAFLPSTFDLQAGQQATLTVVGSSGAPRSVTITIGTG
nr:PDZ domain-containing protein [Candidatus Dormibacteraeota bacterium]